VLGLNNEKQRFEYNPGSFSQLSKSSSSVLRTG